VVSALQGKTCVEIEIHEGRNRQIHRMFERLGYSVERLKRLEVAGLKLGRLKPGQCRLLLRSEVGRLREAVGLGKGPGAGRCFRKGLNESDI
jgi:23S rRNA pseudouridine2605 synthase